VSTEQVSAATAGQVLLPGGTGNSTLVDLLDRVIDRGVVIQGDLVLSVAGIDLVHVGVQLVLKGVEEGDVW
jgi:hypothetical protein